MPNHITNRITLKGGQKEIEKLIEQFSTHHERVPSTAVDGRQICRFKDEPFSRFGWINHETNEFEENGKPIVVGLPEGWELDFKEAWTQFPDFNKVFPIPEELTIEVHQGILDAAAYAMKLPTDLSIVGELQKQNREKQKSPLEFNDRDWELFIQCMNNQRKHGYMYWYDVQRDKWGTKWNAYECIEIDENCYEFQTAWSCVPKIIEEISKKYPTVEIEYIFADEDTGYNVGKGTILNGDGSMFIPEGGSKEAYQIAFELKPELVDEYRETDTGYKHIEEE